MKSIKFLLTIYSAIAMILGFLIIIVPVSIVALPFKNYKSRLKITAPFWRLYFVFILKCITFSKCVSIDRRDKDQRVLMPKGLYIGNHQSFMDIPIAFSHFIIAPIMKKSLLYIPVFGITAYSSGALIVDRGNRKSRVKTFEDASARLRSPGGSLFYYPEGTRTKDKSGPKTFEKIKTKLMRVAYQNNIPVYAISVYGTDNILTSSGSINYSERIGIILHAPLSPSDYEDETEFVKACWGKVQSGYEELKLM